MDWQLDGHKRQLEFLENALNRGKLAHAYVFAGPSGVGKRQIAMKLAEQLLESGIKDFHPDFLEINSDNGIKIEQIRDLIYKLSLKPYQSKNKVALINEADEMTVEAANALLKSLEEPKSFTYLFLITTNPNRLPKTILSRCQKLTFGPLGNNKAEETGDQYLTFRNAETVDRLIAASEIAELETGEIKNLLDSWLVEMQKELRISATKGLAKKISVVLFSRKMLDQNVNSKLLLTNLMLNT